MSADEKHGERRRNSPDESGSSPAPAEPKKNKKAPPAPEFGHALRSAYQRTLDEDIPPEMLDLLGKLG